MNKHLSLVYLDTLTNFLKKKYYNELISIILFGSLVNSKEKPSTDVDLIIITNDSCSSKDFQKIRRDLAIVEQVFFAKTRERELSFFSHGLQRATGMFMNFFLCRLSDFQKRNFKVFNVNPFIATLLAPQNSVWLSLSNRHRIIWGENVFQHWKNLPSLTKGDLVRSFVMNWLLATGALVFYPVYSHIAKFSMEAMKWSLFTWQNLYHPKKTLSKTIAKYIEHGLVVERQALQCFLKFRKNKSASRHFVILAWIFVFLLHKSLFHRSYG